MRIRKYKYEDCDIISNLFYETVHSVNVCDYTTEQLFAWAKNSESLKARYIDLLNQNTLIAEIDGIIVGFASIDKSGCLDLLFIHKDYQRQGIATALCDELEKEFCEITAFVSITAKPFFEKRGYVVEKSQDVERSGVRLRNYEMKKKNSTLY